MGAKLGAIFLIVIALGVVLYLYNSGAVGGGVDFLKSLAPVPATSTSESYAPPSENVPGGGAGAGAFDGTTIAPAPEPAPAPPANPNLTPENVPPGFTMDQLSPYFQEVRFGGLGAVPPPELGSTAYGTITLYTSYGNPSTTIDVTGWEIKTNRGGEYVPQAITYYDPLGLNPPSDIVLRSGDYVNIYSSSAPLNLRQNECIGYLPNLGQFNPPLPQVCPPIDTNDIQSFSGACQDYIYSLGGCQSPDLSSPQIPAYDYSCRQYLTNRYTYKWCYDTYFTDPNFLSNEVDVWTGSSPLDQYHDQVELLDRNGLLVDYASY